MPVVSLLTDISPLDISPQSAQTRPLGQKLPWTKAAFILNCKALSASRMKDKSIAVSNKSCQQVHRSSWPVADPGRAKST